MYKKSSLSNTYGKRLRTGRQLPPPRSIRLAELRQCEFPNLPNMDLTLVFWLTLCRFRSVSGQAWTAKKEKKPKSKLERLEKWSPIGFKSI